MNLQRTSIYLFLKAAADKNYRTVGKFIGRGPVPISLTASHFPVPSWSLHHHIPVLSWSLPLPHLPVHFQNLSPLSVPLLCLFLHIGVDECMSFIFSRVDLMLSSSYTNSKIVITMYLVYLYHVGPNCNIVRVLTCNVMFTDHCITELLV